MNKTRIVGKGEFELRKISNGNYQCSMCYDEAKFQIVKNFEDNAFGDIWLCRDCSKTIIKKSLLKPFKKQKQPKLTKQEEFESDIFLKSGYDPDSVPKRTTIDEFNKQMKKVTECPTPTMTDKEIQEALKIMNSPNNLWIEKPPVTAKDVANINNTLIDIEKSLKESSAEFIRIFRLAYGVVV